MESTESTLDLLEHSPFFEGFQAEDLEALAKAARPRTAHTEDVLFSEGARAETLYVLESGQVRLEVRTRRSDPAHSGDDRPIVLRTIREPGRVLGWSVMVEPYRYRASAVALAETRLLALDRAWLEQRAGEKPGFGQELMKSILYVLGNRLRETRVRLVARRYDQETLALRALIDQSSEQLSVSSPLRKIPIYLENRLTVADAFETLELLRLHGDEVERSLAGLALDILENISRELRVYQKLQAIYENVANAPESANPALIRKRSAEDFIDLFSQTRFEIRGEENLPETPGHIFVMNHLQNHPENTIVDGFQLTLDSHFVSAMIIYRKYGTAPVRVIRKSRPDEYGHQRYYSRLGYIYVYAGHVDEDRENPEHLAEQRRTQFLEQARSCLLEGENIVICPEGTSGTTTKSPRPFRAGAFRLAAFVRPEPLIVPVAVANFDQRITRVPLVAVIHEPFRLSEHVPEGADDQVLFDFINGFYERFRSFVREAVEIADGMK